MLSGIDRPAMSVERQLCRNSQMTSTAKTAPMRPSRHSEAMLSSMKVDWSRTVVRVTLSPSFWSRSAMVSVTALATSTVFASEVLTTETPTDSAPFVRVTAVGFLARMRTSAMSPSLTLPSSVATTRSLKAATVVASARTVTG